MNAATGRIQRRGPAAEQGRLVTPPRRLLDKLRALDLAEAKPGIRACDVAAFTKVARLTNTAILLRATNPKSLRFIGDKRYVAKPCDCKAKTATADDIVYGQIVECGGLVADPTRLSGKGFFAVDTAPPDTLRRHHGCLLVTEQDMPKDFDPAGPGQLLHLAHAGRHAPAECRDRPWADFFRYVLRTELVRCSP